MFRKAMNSWKALWEIIYKAFSAKMDFSDPERREKS